MNRSTGSLRKTCPSHPFLLLLQGPSPLNAAHHHSSPLQAFPSECALLRQHAWRTPKAPWSAPLLHHTCARLPSVCCEAKLPATIDFCELAPQFQNKLPHAQKPRERPFAPTLAVWYALWRAIPSIVTIRDWPAIFVPSVLTGPSWHFTLRTPRPILLIFPLHPQSIMLHDLR